MNEIKLVELQPCPQVLSCLSTVVEQKRAYSSQSLHHPIHSWYFSLFQCTMSCFSLVGTFQINQILLIGSHSVLLWHQKHHSKVQVMRTVILSRQFCQEHHWSRFDLLGVVQMSHQFQVATPSSFENMDTCMGGGSEKETTLDRNYAQKQKFYS